MSESHGLIQLTGEYAAVIHQHFEDFESFEAGIKPIQEAVFAELPPGVDYQPLLIQRLRAAFEDLPKPLSQSA